LPIQINASAIRITSAFHRSGSDRDIMIVQEEPRAREWRGLLAAQLKRTLARYARESSDNPMANAFCRVAPSVRFRDLAIFFAGTFFLASDFSSRTCTDVQARLFDPFFGMYDLPATNRIGL